jgi:ribosomal-protein-alanine N-acetyltransferase
MNELRGEQLSLRPLLDTDVDAVFGILNDEETTALVSWRQTSRESAAAWLSRRIDDQRQHGASMWGIELSDTKVLAGLCGFFPRAVTRWELGYVVQARYWRRGLATEAASLAVEHALALGREVFATIRPGNLGSRTVAERAGLRLAGHEYDVRGELLLYVGGR